MPRPYCPRTVSMDMDRLNRAPHLHSLPAHRLGLEGDRRLHGDKRQQLHHVVLHHVAQRARLLIERAAALDADLFRGGDLNVIDIVPVPDGLEDAVGEAEDEDVLHRLLAQVMIDAEDLFFGEYTVHFIVQRARRGQVMAEWLFDDQAHLALLGFGHAVRAKLLNDLGKILRRRCQVEEPVALGALLLVDLLEQGHRVAVAFGVIEVHGVVVHPLQ